MILFYQDRITTALVIFLSITLLLGGISFITRKHRKKRFFIKSELCMLGLLFVLCVLGRFGKWINVESADSKTYSASALKKDLGQLENILFQESPLYYTDRKALKQKFEEVEQQITGDMTEEEFYRLINPLVVDVQCGHTNLSISKALQRNREEKAKFLPLDIYVQGNKLIDKETNDTIVSINGHPADKIIDMLLENISHDGDNLAGAYYILNLCFPIKYYDFIEQPEEFVIEYERSDGTKDSKVVQAAYNETYNVNSWEIRMAQYKDIDYYSSSFSGDTATLRIHVFMEGKRSFSKFLEEFFRQVKENQCKKVVIDVRGNFGGDPRMAKELLSYLVSEPFQYFKSDLSLVEKIAGYGKEVVPKENSTDFESELVIDGACFSTCSHFAAIYQSLSLGKVKGDPTGGGSICTDGSKDIVLYETGLRLHYATKVFAVNADCEKTNVVLPD